MIKKYIIDDDLVLVDLIYEAYSAEILRVTSHSDSWEQYISGRRKIRIEGKKKSGNIVKADFEILGSTEGVLVLKSLDSQRNEETYAVD